MHFPWTASNDLNRFGVSPFPKTDAKLRYSFIDRPAPYSLAPRMTLATGDLVGSQWDDVMFQMARWLTRHLNDVKLILWLIDQGGQLNKRLSQQIEQTLDYYSSLERDCKTAELNEIRENAPNAIPSKLTRILWHILLATSQFN